MGRIRVLHAVTVSKSLKLMKGQLSYLKKLGYEVSVVSSMYHADLLGLLAGRLVGIKHILWNIRHSNLDPKINKKQTIMVAKLCSILSSKTSRIICCSQASLECHQHLGYDKEKMAVIPNGFNLDLFKPNPNNKVSKQLLEELSLPRDAFIVGHVARWDGQKDHANLIKAAK